MKKDCVSTTLSRSRVISRLCALNTLRKSVVYGDKPLRHCRKRR